MYIFLYIFLDIFHNEKDGDSSIQKLLYIVSWGNCKKVNTIFHPTFETKDFSIIIVAVLISLSPADPTTKSPVGIQWETVASLVGELVTFYKE